VIISDLGTQRCEVERSGHAQRPREGSAALRLGEALAVAMQVGAASREPACRVGHGDAGQRHHAQQLRRRRAGSATDAGALRSG
jgi:hypothetical protein